MKSTDGSISMGDFDKRFVQALERLKGRRAAVREKIAKCRVDIYEQQKRLSDSLKARVLVQTVAQETQKKLEHHISNVVTLAESSVFPDPYRFEIEFVQRRNKTECDVWFVKGSERMDPMTSSGGGPLDVASFAIRCLFLTLRPVRPIVVLDEPFRFVSVDLQERCGEMLKAISERLGLQIIMISHLPRIYTGADKIFRVTQSKGESKVEEV